MPSLPAVPSFLSLVPMLLSLALFGFLLWGAYWFLLGRFKDMPGEQRFPRQLALFGLGLVFLVLLVIMMPISDTSKSQLLGIIGLILSGVIAISSTSLIANLMAGISLRLSRPFHVGDYIRVADHFGRVSDISFFDTEIQSENREFISIPNAFMVRNPVSTVRSSGTIISSTLTLGYDVHHAKIEELLLQAAQQSELDEPFVHILELGNFAVSYRISGYLKDVKGLITSRSRLNRNILETLHNAGIEIMSPTIMNQRRIADDQKIIPLSVQKPIATEKTVAEDIVFDKAQKAGELAKEKSGILKEIKRLEDQLKNAEAEQKTQLKEDLERQATRLKFIGDAIAKVSSGDDE